MSNCLPEHGTEQLVFPVFDEGLTVLWDQQKHKSREVVFPAYLRPLLLCSFEAHIHEGNRFGISDFDFD